MLLKVYKSRVWVLLFMLLPFVGSAQIPGLPAEWAFTLNPTSGTYAIQTDVTFDGVDALEVGDWAGAFYNDGGVMECGGAVQWLGDSSVAIVIFGNDTLVAPDKNGFSEGEMITWKFYRDASGLEEEVMSTPEFNWTNGALEEVTGFYVDNVITIEIPLYTEYQFVSSPIVTEDMNMVTVLEDVLPTIEFVRTNDGKELFFSPFPPPGGWNNGIGDWNNFDGYYFNNTSFENTLVMEGALVDPTIPMDIPVGYRFVGYPYNSPQNALDAFADILDDISFIRTNDGKEIFYSPFPPPGGWNNGIGDCQPGDGYYIKVDNPITGFVFPEPSPSDASSTVIRPKVQSPKTGHFTPPSGGQPTDIWKLVLGECNVDGVQIEDGDELAIFDGENIVGLTVFNGFIPFTTKVDAFVNLYTVGAPYSLVLWDESAQEEVLNYEITLDEEFGYFGTTFPPAGNPTSYVMALNFIPEDCDAPVLVSAVGGQNVVDLSWTAIPESDAARTGHFTPPSGGQPTDIWKLVLGECNVNGVQIEDGDELAIFDGENIVGLTVFNGFIPFTTKVDAFVNLYTVGAPYSLVLWDESAQEEISNYEITLDEEFGYFGTTFPPAGNPTSYVMALNFISESPVSFNVYFEDGTLVEANVEGTTYQVTGLEDGTEYCFYVTENLEGGESCMSNVLCATTDTGCDDVVINNFPAAPADLCLGEALAIDFSGVEVLNAVSEVWSVDPFGAGAFDGTTFNLNTAYVGFVTVSVFGEATPPCADGYASLTFEVFALPVVECPESDTVCIGSAIIDFAEVVGGVYTNANGGIVTGFNPVEVGFFDFTLTVTVNGCSDFCYFYIAVTDAPTASAGMDQEICENETVQLDGTAANYSSLMWTGGLGVFDDASILNPTYTPDVSEVGTTVSLCLAAQPLYPCTVAATDCMELFIQAAPTVDILTDQVTICEADVFDFTGLVIAANYSSVQWLSINGAGTFSDDMQLEPTYFPSPIDILQGCVILHVTANPINPCTVSASDEMELCFQMLPTVDAGENQDICEGDVANLTAFAENYSSVMWTGGLGTFDDISILNPIYTPDVSEVGTTVTLCVEAQPISPCMTAASDCMDLFIQALPVPNAGMDATIGAEDTYALADATIANLQEDDFSWWETSGDGTFDDSFDLNPVYTPGEDDIANGSVELCLLVNSFYCGVDVMDCMTLTIDSGGCINPPTADAGDDDVVCANEVYQLDATATNYSALMWTSAGDGMFDDATVLNPVYTPGAEDLMNGVELCLTAEPIEVACDPVMDCMMLSFNALPYVDIVLSAEVICLDETLYATITGPEDGAYPYMLTGIFNDEPIEGLMESSVKELELVAPAPGTYVGLLTGIVDFNGCAVELNEEFTVVVNSLPTLTYAYSALEICLGETIDVTVEGPADGAYPYTVDYTVNGMPMQDIIEDAFLQYPLTPDMAMTYEFVVVSITDDNGCVAMPNDVYSVVVNPLPIVECPEFVGVCEGSEYIEFDMVEMGEYTNEAGDVVTGFEPDMAGSYMFYLTVTNEFGCTDMCMFTIVVNPLPVAVCPEFEAVCAGTEYLGFPMVDMGEYTNEAGDVVTGFDPEMAGTYMFYLTVSNEFDCYAMCEFEIVVNAAPVITAQPMNAEELWGTTATFEVMAENVASYEWYFDGGVVGTEATLVLNDIDNDDAGDYYVMLTSEFGCTVMSDVVTLTVSPWTQVINFGGKVNGFSTYLELLDDDAATIFAGIDVKTVSFRQPAFIWTPANVTFAYNEEKGAKVTRNVSTSATTTVTGYPTLGTDVQLLAGDNFMPVWSQDVVMAEDVFGDLVGLNFAWSHDYSGFYWPAYNLTSLQYLVPGSSYLVNMADGATVSFDVPAVNATVPVFVDLPANKTSWDDATLTATQHNIVLTSEAIAQLEVGDVVGAFNQYGQIAGMVEIDNLRENTAIRTYGDDPSTKEIEGFVEGDVMTIKVWRNGVEMTALATFGQELPNQNVFAQDGASVITELKLGATSINEIGADLTASLYPNPATDVVNIQTNFEIKSLKVVNYVGQVVYNQSVNQNDFQINTSNYGSGMYFVQIETTEGVVITKRLTIK